MNVLHINSADNIGGAARAAYRLHTGLQQLGVVSRMLVKEKATSDPDVQLLQSSGPFIKLVDRAARVATGLLSLQYLFYPSSFGLPRSAWGREADLTNLHNTHGGCFSHTGLPWLSRERPVVWTLHDMWSMTGHCAYSYDCQRWQTGCGSCPRLSDYPSLQWDTTALLWKIKNWVYNRSRLTIVTPSRWLASLASSSPLLSRFPVHCIPNGLDTKVFRPMAREAARDVLNIARKGRIILFSAHSLADPRKGGDLLKAALDRLARTDLSDVSLLVGGQDAEEWQAPACFDVVSLGAVSDDQLLSACYAAADLFVLPTLADNLPNGPLEAMACGTPSVSFRVGGVSDAVRHLETGYLAPAGDVEGLAHGIRLLLTDDDLRLKLGHRSRQVAEAEYTMELQAKRYLALYQSLIEERNAG